MSLTCQTVSLLLCPYYNFITKLLHQSQDFPYIIIVLTSGTPLSLHLNMYILEISSSISRVPWTYMTHSPQINYFQEQTIQKPNFIKIITPIKTHRYCNINNFNYAAFIYYHVQLVYYQLLYVISLFYTIFYFYSYQLSVKIIHQHSLNTKENIFSYYSYYPTPISLFKFLIILYNIIINNSNANWLPSPKKTLKCIIQLKIQIQQSNFINNFIIIELRHIILLILQFQK
eukprot:TRINITY_DN5518_c1_g1_i1.p2 TRINITY_DN5518_c1_g1~~TRINITY_DN5518_c1_g1_i1.p2  ORF type:complete len:230 (+),score=-21.94 TRINITY_DN5518_c1_g1_i1:274-963(+)